MNIKKFNNTLKDLKNWKVKFYWPTDSLGGRFRVYNLWTWKSFEISQYYPDFIDFLNRNNRDGFINDLVDYLSFKSRKKILFSFQDKDFYYFGF